MKSNKNLSLRKIGIAAITHLYASKYDPFEDTWTSVNAADGDVDLSIPSKPHHFSSHEHFVEYASGSNFRVWSIQRGIEFLQKEKDLTLLEAIAQLDEVPSFVIKNEWVNSDYGSRDEYVIYRLTPKQEREIADAIDARKHPRQLKAA